jgi:hypothetical protein
MKIFSGLLVGCAESTQHAIILLGWRLGVNCASSCLVHNLHFQAGHGSIDSIVLDNRHAWTVTSVTVYVVFVDQNHWRDKARTDH